MSRPTPTAIRVANAMQRRQQHTTAAVKALQQLGGGWAARLLTPAHHSANVLMRAYTNLRAIGLEDLEREVRQSGPIIVDNQLIETMAGEAEQAERKISDLEERHASAKRLWQEQLSDNLMLCTKTDRLKRVIADTRRDVETAERIATERAKKIAELRKQLKDERKRTAVASAEADCWYLECLNGSLGITP